LSLQLPGIDAPEEYGHRAIKLPPKQIAVFALVQTGKSANAVDTNIVEAQRKKEFLSILIRLEVYMRGKINDQA
jgi:hypothetical protein